MIRVCPKCGDYYAGEEFTFCLTDGMPLANVIPNGPAWSNGLRVVEDKRRVLKQTRRRLRLRRMFMTVTTVLMTMLILSVAAVNGWIYLRRETAPTRSPVVSSSLPVREPSPTGQLLPLSPDSLLFLPSPSPSPSHSPSPSPSPRRSATPAVCPPAEMARAREMIISALHGKTQAEEKSPYLGPGRPPADVTLSEFNYQLKFNKSCNEVVATVRYLLRVIGPATPYINSPRSRSFGCMKTHGSWICS